MKQVAVITVALMLVSFSLTQDVPNAAKPIRVPDSETAIRIAEKALIPVYGKKRIESERPFHATLEGAVWTVTGTCEGLCGFALVRISRKSGRVLYMEHTK
jgi:hypothetical protein